MRILRSLAILVLVLAPFTLARPAHAQVSVDIGIGAPVVPYYVEAPPVCPYGYYGYAPYSCAPYGYYGPEWFVSGVFIGAGPWYHRGWGYPGYYRGAYGYPRGYYGGYRGGYYGGYRGGYYGGRGFEGYRGGYAGGGFHGGNSGGGFNGGYSGGGGFHGGRR